MQKFESLIDEFCYKCYNYAGDVIELSVNETNGGTPEFIWKDNNLGKSLSESQKTELKKILQKAMDEIVKHKPREQGVKEFLGWN